MGIRILALAALLSLGSFAEVHAQPPPLSPIRHAGQSVTPAFEGWYRNPDGTFSLSFGYFNRNATESVDIPVGPNNYLTPEPLNRGQPTHFAPRRHWGVFVVTVPADFGDKRVVWTLIHRGDTVAIPGSLKRNWEIDALEGEAGSGNTPPVVFFDPAGPKGRGPGGAQASMSAKAGEAVTLTVWATDDGRARTSVGSSGRTGVTPSLTWFTHQSPPDARVTFSNASPAVDNETGKSTTTAKFSAPGEYILRVRVNDASGVASAGHAQCCWTNGYVRMTVTKEE
jgi:hypothetical protein